MNGNYTDEETNKNCATNGVEYTYAQFTHFNNHCSLFQFPKPGFQTVKPGFLALENVRVTQVFRFGGTGLNPKL